MNKTESVSRYEITPAKDLKISRLLNSIQFYLECTFIVHVDKGYRLIILHSGKVLMDTRYNTLRGAKIAFTKYFGRRAWQEDIKPMWSHAYHPDEAWVKQHSDIITNYRAHHPVEEFVI
jgi:hypothetical protein